MTTTETGRPSRLHRPGTHGLLVADTDVDRRTRTAAWVGRELARGSKVYYKGWLDDGAPPDRHWIAGPRGAPGGGAALASGQLEFLDFPAVVQRCGGTTEGLFQLQDDECRRAVGDGWPSVAMSQESAHRPMADDDEAVEFAAQEQGYDVLATRWPLVTLCQLTVEEENRRAAWESAAVHFREITDVHWSSTFYDGCWQPRGELDAHVVARFGAALEGALRDALQAADGPDLHVDLAAVEFMDFACAQVLMLNARSASQRQRVMVHRAPPIVRHMIVAAGRPATLVFDDEEVAR